MKRARGAADRSFGRDEEDLLWSVSRESETKLRAAGPFRAGYRRFLGSSELAGELAPARKARPTVACLGFRFLRPCSGTRASGPFPQLGKGSVVERANPNVAVTAERYLSRRLTLPLLDVPTLREVDRHPTSPVRLREARCQASSEELDFARQGSGFLGIPNDHVGTRAVREMQPKVVRLTNRSREKVVVLRRAAYQEGPAIGTVEAACDAPNPLEIAQAGRC